MRRVVCAATRLQSGLILCGARHCDSLMLAQCKAANHKYIHKEEGFIDQFGVFMSRQDAWIVATAANQIFRRVGGDDSNGGTLYSENLY